MAKTAQLELPLLAPSQAQKHVTVNEALARLDAVAQLRVKSSTLSGPPATVEEGAGYLVAETASGDWVGQEGRIAVRSNGGWVFLAPRAGWRAWDESRGGYLLHDGTAWVPDAVVASPNGAGMIWKVLEFDHTIVPAATNSTTVTIPAQTQLVGVTGRVVGALTGGGLTGWRLGVAGADNRYGSGLGTALNSYVVGLSGSPVTYYAPTPLLLTGEGGSFGSGRIRLALHCVGIEPPRPV